MTEYGLIVVLVFLDFYQSIMLTVEYFWGRSDTDIKNEAKRKKKLREKYRFDSLTVGEGK